MSNYALKDQEIDWICKSIHPEAVLRWAERLVGGVTSDMYLCTMADWRGIQGGDDRTGLGKVVFRRLANSDGTAWDPEMAEYEAWALRTAEKAGVVTPHLIATNGSTDDGLYPMTLMSCVPGNVVLVPEDMDKWLREMAKAMYAIHQLPADDAPYNYFPYYGEGQPVLPEWSERPDAWQRAIDIALGQAPPQPMHFIHRDFHPCNVLFEGDRLSGVVDWTNSCRGMAGGDVAHCRWNLALLHGIDVADRFIEMYQEFAGQDWKYDPYFDIVELCEKLGWVPNVYPGWPALGVTDLNDALMMQRTEAMLLSALARC